MSTLLVLGTLLLTVRTAVSFITGSAIVYFAQPMATAVVISIVLIASAALGCPFTQRFAHDFCPIDPELLALAARPAVLHPDLAAVGHGPAPQRRHRAVLLSSSLHAFVLERSAVTYGLTAVAIYLSVTRFVATMRRDGITVEWAANRVQEPQSAPVG